MRSVKAKFFIALAMAPILPGVDGSIRITLGITVYL